MFSIKNFRFLFPVQSIGPIRASDGQRQTARLAGSFVGNGRRTNEDNIFFVVHELFTSLWGPILRRFFAVFPSFLPRRSGLACAPFGGATEALALGWRILSFD
ncbi:MAG: hypothetical protein ACK45B_11775 [Limisphaerales bacterium]